MSRGWVLDSKKDEEGNKAGCVAASRPGFSKRVVR